MFVPVDLEVSLYRMSSTRNIFFVKTMSVGVNVIVSLMSVMSPAHALSNMSVRTLVKLSTFVVFVLGVSLVSWGCGDVCEEWVGA